MLDRLSRRILVRLYRYVAGQKKPCMFCGEMFMPVYHGFHTNIDYSPSLFCKLDCETKFIRTALGRLASTRHIKHDVSDVPNEEVQSLPTYEHYEQGRRKA